VAYRPGPTTLVAADQIAKQRGLLACDGPDLLCHDDGVDDDFLFGDGADTAAFQYVADDVRPRVWQVVVGDELPEPIHVPP
jgi:hypothetical protein